MNEDLEMLKATIPEPDDFFERNTVNFAVAGMKKEIDNQVHDMPIEVLHMLVKMMKDKDWVSLRNLNDFVAFIRALGNLLPHEKQKELFDYTEGLAKNVLREKTMKELTKTITEAIHEAVREKNRREANTAREIAEQRRKELSEALETAGYRRATELERQAELKKWMMENARNAFSHNDEEEGECDCKNCLHGSTICG